MRKRFCGGMVLGTVAPLFLSGCGGGGSASPQTSGPVSATGRYAHLRFSATAPKRTYAVGEPIPLTFTVQNTGTTEENILLYRGALNGAVSLPNGLQVATLNQSAVYPGNIVPLQSMAFPPGETKTFAQRWDQQTAADQGGTQAPLGKYRIRVYFDVDTLSGRTVPAGDLGTDNLTIEIK